MCYDISANRSIGQRYAEKHFVYFYTLKFFQNHTSLNVFLCNFVQLSVVSIPRHRDGNTTRAFHF